MMKLAMSRAASGLLRALIKRAGVDCDRILLSEFRSVDWHSLTMSGERHVVKLRVPGPNADSVVHALTWGIEDAEFAIPGQIVADIVALDPPVRAADKSLLVTIEALTIAE